MSDDQTVETTETAPEINAESMTEAQADEILAKAFAEPDTEIQVTEPAPDKSQELAQDETKPAEVISAEDKSVTETGKPASDGTPIDYKAKYEEAEQKRKSYDGRIQAEIRTAEELRARNAEYEAKVQQYQKFDQLLQDPRYANAFLQGTPPPSQVDPNFDYTNPANIVQIASLAAKQEVQQNRQDDYQKQIAQARMNFNAVTRANKIKLALERNVDIGVVDAWEKKLEQDMLSGHISQVAERHANFDTIVAEAEQRGAVKERDRIAKLKNVPIRTGSTSSGTPQSKTGVVDFSKLDPSSPEYDIALKKAMREMDIAP